VCFVGEKRCDEAVRKRVSCWSCLGGVGAGSVPRDIGAGAVCDNGQRGHVGFVRCDYRVAIGWIARMPFNYLKKLYVLLAIQ